MYILILILYFCMINFMISKHPLSKGLNLLLSTIMISLLTLLLNLNSWYSYILFLIMIGGMLILFIYMTSVSSNEKFYFNWKNLIFLTSFMLFSSSIWIIDKYTYSKPFKMFNMFNFERPINFEISMNKFFLYPHNMILIMMIIYLLITLIAIVNITESSWGPLRKKN